MLVDVERGSNMVVSEMQGFLGPLQDGCTAWMDRPIEARSLTANQRCDLMGIIEGATELPEHGCDGLDSYLWNEFANGCYHACYSISNIHSDRYAPSNVDDTYHSSLYHKTCIPKCRAPPCCPTLSTRTLAFVPLLMQERCTPLAPLRHLRIALGLHVAPHLEELLATLLEERDCTIHMPSPRCVLDDLSVMLQLQYQQLHEAPINHLHNPHHEVAIFVHLAEAQALGTQSGRSLDWPDQCKSLLQCALYRWVRAGLLA
jgi:hypothetical protein